MVLHHKDECQTPVQDRNSLTDFLSKRFGRCDSSLSELAQCTTHPPEVSSKTQRNSCLDCLIYDKVCSEVLALCSCFASRLVQNVFTFDEVGLVVIEPPELLGVLSDICNIMTGCSCLPTVSNQCLKPIQPCIGVP